MTRRELNARLMAGAALAAAGGVPGVLLAQPKDRGKPPSKQPAPASFLENVITRGKERDWTLHASVNVRAYRTKAQHVRRDEMPVITKFDFDTVAVVFPVIPGCASSETKTSAVGSVLSWDENDQGVKPVYSDNYPCGTRLGRWELRDVQGDELELKLQLPMTTWETKFDEELAGKAQWPKDGKWGRVAGSALKPEAYIESTHPDVQKLLAAWTNNKPPASQPPLVLAKFLAAKMLEHMTPTGVGLVANYLGGLVGFDFTDADGNPRTVGDVLRDGRGSEHDVARALVAVYRAAGLPSRVVIGFDQTAKKDNDTIFLDRKNSNFALRSWVEFCLYDEARRKEAWIPVDIVRQRKSTSSRAPDVARPWKYFGNHEQLEAVLPVSFHYLPPTTVVSYGAPALWGWFVTPEVQPAEQLVRFYAVSAPHRSGSKNDKDKRGR